jgi:APA family basic amino acid/polyamine antiporter
VPFSLRKLAVLPILGILFNLLMLTQLEIRVMAIGLGLGGLGALAALISMRYIRSDIKNN